MQTGKETTIRLLVIHDSAEAAEAVVNAIRNGGIAVRPLRPQTQAELAEMLGAQAVDLVIAAPSPAFPLPSVRQAVDVSGKDIPLIAVVEHVDDALLPALLDQGVRAVAVARHAEHLLGVVRIEFGNLEARRGLRRIEAQLRETERRCDALIASSRDPIAYIHEGMHIRANDAYLEMFGFESFEDVEGLSLLDLIAPQQVGEFKQLLKSMSKGEPPPPHYETQARGADGETFPATMEFATATWEGEPCIQVVFRRREEVDPELARELEALRQRDAVTGLLNRPTFLHALEDAVARVGRGEALYGLLLLEPDHYARLLPDIGIDSADALVAALAVHLQASLGDEATIARVGDHGFGVLLEGTYPQTVTTAERLRDAFAGHVFAIGERSIAVTASIGGVQIGEKIASVGPVLAKAAESLRTALDLGGGAIHVYDPSAVDRAEEERIQLWVKRIAESLQGDGFVLHYLPVLNLLGAPGELYETVLRMQVNDELAMPSAFLGIAEDHDLLGAIDHWVVRRAIATLGERLRAGHDTRLLVKVSPASFGSPLLAGLIERELAKHGVPGERLWLETPEAKVFTHLRNAQDFLAAAGRLGCRVGLEQFGSGLDSFQLLSHFRPSFLKIDRSFTDDLSSITEHQEKIAGIVERARAIGIPTIAEHVQDAATMTHLFSAGVDYVEGQFVGLAGPRMDYEFA